MTLLNVDQPIGGIIQVAARAYANDLKIGHWYLRWPLCQSAVKA